MPKGIFIRKPFTETHKKNISKAKMGFIAWNKGLKGWLKHTEESKIKMSIPKKGKKCSNETKQKMSEIAKTRTGNKNPNWRGGLMQDKEYQNKRQLLKCNMRRAIKNKTPGTYTLKEWELLKLKYKYTCPKCGKKEPEIKLAADHIVPLNVGGTNYIENIQPLCKSCNCSKQAKTFKIDPKGQYELCLQ